MDILVKMMERVYYCDYDERNNGHVLRFKVTTTKFSHFSDQQLKLVEGVEGRRVTVSREMGPATCYLLFTRIQLIYTFATKVYFKRQENNCHFF